MSQISLKLRYKKGIYGTVGVFLFIVVLVIIVIGLVGYGQLLANLESETVRQANTINLANSIKDKFLFCFGVNDQVIQSKINNDCDTQYGFRYTTIAYDVCSNLNVSIQKGSVTRNVFTYSIPYHAELQARVCPGRLEVFL